MLEAHPLIPLIPSDDVKAPNAFPTAWFQGSGAVTIQQGGYLKSFSTVGW